MKTRELAVEQHGAWQRQNRQRGPQERRPLRAQHFHRDGEQVVAGDVRIRHGLELKHSAEVAAAMKPQIREHDGAREMIRIILKKQRRVPVQHDHINCGHDDGQERCPRRGCGLQSPTHRFWVSRIRHAAPPAAARVRLSNQIFRPSNLSHRATR